MSRTGNETVHASCVVFGEAGILILGPSGSGKSSLARALIEVATDTGTFGALVGDDRVVLSPRSGRVLARGHQAVQGLLEMRGLGLLRLPSEPACVVRLAVVCGADPPRFPEACDESLVLCGLSVPRLLVAHGGRDAAYTVRWKLRGLDDTSVTVPGP